MVKDNRNLLLTCAVTFVVLFCMMSHLLRADESDKNWILLWSSMLLEGRQLYTQALSVLPPMIFWIYSLPVMLSQATGMADQHILVILGFVLIAGVITLSMRVMRSHPALQESSTRHRQSLLLLLMTLVVWFDSQSFLDREHLFFVLSLPYMLRWLPGIKVDCLTLQHRIISGLLCAIGLCIKPHLIMLFLAIQAHVVARTRSAAILFSLENLIIYGIGVAYVLVVVSHYPFYITQVLPMAAATYTGVADSVQKLNYAGSTYFIFLVTFIHFAWNRKSPYRSDIYYLLTICGAWLLYALLNNGWYYTWAPLGSLLLFTTGWVVWENLYFRTLSAQDQHNIRWGQIACWINMMGNTAMVIAFNIALYSLGCHDVCKKTNALSELVRKEQTTSFGVISIEFSVWADVARHTGAVWQTRINHLWMLPKILSDAQNRNHYDSVMSYVEKAFAEDMRLHKPDLMFVDDTSLFYDVRHADVNLVTLLSSDAAFREEWRHYSYLTSINHCRASRDRVSGRLTYDRRNCKYDVYKRNY